MRHPLFSVTREGVTEVVVSGEVFAHDGERVCARSWEGQGSFPARSLLKPFQFHATGLLESGEWHPRYAPALGSVSATEEQLATIFEWYQTPEFIARTSQVKLLPAFPLDDLHRMQLQRSEESPSIFFNNCFSKHMAILEACARQGWPTETYLQQDHPYHARLTALLERLTGKKPAFEKCVADGCLLPTPILALSDLALLYQKLAEGAEGLGFLWKKMAENPTWIGGPGRMDTRLMEENLGLVVAKEGADGLIGIAVAPRKDFPRGLGAVVKLDAGFFANLAMLGLDPLLQKLGLKSPAVFPKAQKVHFHYAWEKPYSAPLWDISPVLSSKTAVWPGDKPFKRVVSQDTEKGDAVTLSAIETTVHIGAHTDARNHFSANEGGIETAPLSAYTGPCEVMTVTVPPGTAVLPKHLPKAVLSSRLLLKTGSFPNPESFTTDFASCSAELVGYLAGLGVKLMGIDTPSIDPFSSKDLPAHHATLVHHVAILEGIDLSQVPDGQYFLNAGPLKLEGTDASPVRAWLTSL